jgi:nucleoside-diphosphate-sugar epimerase
MSSILIFGSTGFVGSSLVNGLSSDHDLILIDRKPSSPSKYVADILIESSYLNLIRKFQPEVVISNAWCMRGDFRNSELNFSYSEATIKLAENCYKNGVQHFIGIGSSAEFGETNFNGIHFKNDLMPSDHYGRAKLITGNAIAKLSDEYSKSFNWLRVFQAYGKAESRSRFIPTVAFALSRNQPISIENPHRELDWINVEDVSSAVSFILEHQISDCFLEIGTGVPTSVLDVAKLIATKMHKAFEFRDERFLPPKSILLSSPNSSLRQHGWQSKISLSQGLDDLLSQYLDN